jgi:hypothetical protein
MMQQYSSQLFGIADAESPIADVVENYWKIRAEEVLDGEDADVEGERNIFVCHIQEVRKENRSCGWWDVS